MKTGVRDNVQGVVDGILKGEIPEPFDRYSADDVVMGETFPRLAARSSGAARRRVSDPRLPRHVRGGVDHDIFVR